MRSFKERLTTKRLAIEQEEARKSRELAAERDAQEREEAAERRRIEQRIESLQQDPRFKQLEDVVASPVFLEAIDAYFEEFGRDKKRTPPAILYEIDVSDQIPFRIVVSQELETYQSIGGYSVDDWLGSSRVLMTDSENTSPPQVLIVQVVWRENEENVRGEMRPAGLSIEIFKPESQYFAKSFASLDDFLDCLASAIVGKVPLHVGK